MQDRSLVGSFAGGFLFFSLTAAGCSLAVVYLGRVWEGAFVGQGGVATEAAA
jgi:hypothetical protein